jgi:hypothetical protein
VALPILGPVRQFGGTLVALTLAAILAACGGSYTKRDFVARADAICTSTLRETRSITPPSLSGGADAVGALAQDLDKLVPVVRSQAAQLRALKRPPGNASDRAALERYLGAVSEVATQYEQLGAAAERGDAQAVASAEAALRASPIASLAAAYGLSSCGSAAGTGV